MDTLAENYVDHIQRLDEELEGHFQGILKYEPELSRKIVSFQDNKKKPFYGWYKYKEAFSPSLVEYFLEKYKISKGIIFDPFAGIGTTLFASSLIGYDSEGIELLPVGQEIFSNRYLAQFEMKQSELDVLKKWIIERPWILNQNPDRLHCLRITQKAYPQDTEFRVGQYLSELKKVKNTKVKRFLFFVLMCILESISYTRKDGQYLRWDNRSDRKNERSKFNKGIIHNFDDAICQKLKQIIQDIKSPTSGMLFGEKNESYGNIKLCKGSCLDILPQLESEKYQAIITSPPYCNRYDYTRTYALEHALLGISEEDLVKLRQTMLCCTVENKPKELAEISRNYVNVEQLFQNQNLINTILMFLEEQKINGNLNNNSIPRMVKGYFYEMTAVIFECYRVLKNGGYMFTVNDNVRYAGVCIPVDLILSKIAEDIGFEILNILVLPQGKGNSSQQMGGFGRESLRKCVYVWRKP